MNSCGYSPTYILQLWPDGFLIAKSIVRCETIYLVVQVDLWKWNAVCCWYLTLHSTIDHQQWQSRWENHAITWEQRLNSKIWPVNAFVVTSCMYLYTNLTIYLAAITKICGITEWHTHTHTHTCITHTHTHTHASHTHTHTHIHAHTLDEYHMLLGLCSLRHNKLYVV